MELFGSCIMCLLSIYHSFLLAIEMCKFSEMEQSRQEVHLSKSLRGSRWFLGQDLHLVSFPCEPYMHEGLLHVISYLESLHSGYCMCLRSAVPFSSQVLPLLGHPCLVLMEVGGFWGWVVFAASRSTAGRITLL